MRRSATIVAVMAVFGAATSVAAPAASAAVREFWVAAVPAPTWNMAPNERDAIGGINLLQQLSQLGIGRNKTRS